MAKWKKQQSESKGFSDEAGGPTGPPRSKRQQKAAAAATRETTTDTAEKFWTAVAALQELNPGVLQAALNAAATNNQISAAANSTAAAMVGAGLPPAVGGGLVPPAAPSPNVLDPAEMRNLMAGNATTLPGPFNAAQPAAAANGQGRVTFALPDDPSRATLLNKLQEQEREIEDKDTLVDLIKNQGKTCPKTERSLESGCLVSASWSRCWPWYTTKNPSKWSATC